MIVMITSSREPYCYDIPHVVGLPKDYRHRFRYKGKWIRLAEGSVKSIEGSDGLIVLRDVDSGKLIPVRYVQIEKVHSFADIHYIEFRLKEYSHVAGAEKVSDLIEETLQRKNYENKPKSELRCLVFETDAAAIRAAEAKNAKDTKEIDKWRGILDVLGKLRCYKDYSFLKIIKIQNSKEKRVKITKAETGKYLFTLKPNCLYYLDVLQHVPWEQEMTESINAPYDVELKTETDEIIILRKIQRVVGKYDLLRFIFKTPSEQKPKHTFLELENNQNPEIAEHGLSTLFIPVQILVPEWVKYVRFIRYVLLSIAVIILIGAAPIAKLFGIGVDWIKTPAVLVLVFASGKLDEFVSGLVKGAKDIKIPFFK